MHLPTEQTKRINEIDAVRAVALLGILMMNIMTFAGSYINLGTGEPSASYTGTANEYSLWFINSFVTSSFFTMFSFLFGLGFYIFMERARLRSDKPDLLFVRRLVILLIIGILHGVFIWYGDILTQYAITGFWLLLFARVKPVVNLVVPIIIFVVGTLFIGALALLMSRLSGLETLDTTGTDKVPDFLNINFTEIMESGTYMDLVGANTTMFLLSTTGIIITMPIVLAMFLLGLYVGQKNLHMTFHNHLKKIGIFGAIALLIGIPLKLYTGYYMTFPVTPTEEIISGFSYTVGGPLVALGYVALLVILFVKVPVLVRLLQPAGQMALTNYLMQSIVMVTFFKISGLYDQVDAVYFIPISIGFFLVQVALSHVWMKYFTYGPFEWVWRCLTYLRVVPIKRAE